MKLALSDQITGLCVVSDHVRCGTMRIEVFHAFPFLDHDEGIVAVFCR